MSRIEELIAELAPDGVRHLDVAELFDVKNGYTPSKSNPSFWTDGSIPWFRMEDLRANGGVLSSALQQIPEAAVKGGRLFPANSLLFATSATIGEHALITVPHLSNQRFTSLAVKKEYAEQVDIKFLYYYGFILDEWCRSNTTTSSFASVDMVGFRRFRFPVPPLEVQREVVRILDQFTQLEAELEARRRQYEHYRDELLTFREAGGAGGFQWVSLVLSSVGSAGSRKRTSVMGTHDSRAIRMCLAISRLMRMLMTTFELLQGSGNAHLPTATSYLLARLSRWLRSV